MIQKTREFLDTVFAEFKKVQWPTRDKTVTSTVIVMILSLVVAAFLGVADFGLSEVMKVLITL